MQILCTHVHIGAYVWCTHVHIGAYNTKIYAYKCTILCTHVHIVSYKYRSAFQCVLNIILALPPFPLPPPSPCVIRHIQITIQICMLHREKERERERERELYYAHWGLPTLLDLLTLAIPTIRTTSNTLKEAELNTDFRMYVHTYILNVRAHIHSQGSVQIQHIHSQRTCTQARQNVSVSIHTFIHTYTNPSICVFTYLRMQGRM